MGGNAASSVHTSTEAVEQGLIPSAPGTLLLPHIGGNQVDCERMNTYTGSILEEACCQ